MKKLVRFLVLSVFTLLVFVSCSDDGRDGTDGVQGPPGTANVIYSSWFKPAAYTSTMVVGIRHFTYSKDTPEITQDILDKGVVLVYAKLEGYVTSVWPVGQVGQLPISLTYVQGTSTTDTWSAPITLGKVNIDFVNDQNIYATINTAHQFRYIIIPGGVAGKNNLDYSKMTYQEVCQYLNISQ